MPAAPAPEMNIGMTVAIPVSGVDEQEIKIHKHRLNHLEAYRFVISEFVTGSGLAETGAGIKIPVARAMPTTIRAVLFCHIFQASAGMSISVIGPSSSASTTRTSAP